MIGFIRIGGDHQWACVGKRRLRERERRWLHKSSWKRGRLARYLESAKDQELARLLRKKDRLRGQVHHGQ